MALIVTQRSFVLLCVSEVVRFDGGELVSMAGEFNELRSVSFTFKGAVGGFGWSFSLHGSRTVVSHFVFQVTPDQWTMMEAMIRSTKGS